MCVCGCARERERERERDLNEMVSAMLIAGFDFGSEFLALFFLVVKIYDDLVRLSPSRVKQFVHVRV